MKSNAVSSVNSDIIVGCFAFVIVLGLIYNGVASLSIDPKKNTVMTSSIEKL